MSASSTSATGQRRESKPDHGGLYNDVYVKTDVGWRFKTRTYYESKSGEPVQPPPAVIRAPVPFAKVLADPSAGSSAAATKGPSLTVGDYIEIQQLVSRYPYALDVDPDNGASYANLFTPDAVFRQPRTEGREAEHDAVLEEPDVGPLRLTRNKLGRNRTGITYRLAFRYAIPPKSRDNCHIAVTTARSEERGQVHLGGMLRRVPKESTESA